VGWYVYIVECKDKTLYTGISKDVEKRVITHNKGKGAKYTKTRTPVRLLFKQFIGEVGDALREERRIKKLSRKEKLRLILQH
jgi:putative endonuclease